MLGCHFPFSFSKGNFIMFSKLFFLELAFDFQDNLINFYELF